MTAKIMFVFFQNQEVTYTAAEEITRTEKISDLSQLITIMSLTIIALFILVGINLFKNYKLRKKIEQLQSA